MSSAASLIDNVRLVRPGHGIEPGSLLVRDGKIAALNPAAAESAGAVRTDGRGLLLTPGMVDLHEHGIGTSLYERSPEDLIEGAKFLGRFGMTTVLPTLYRVLDRKSLRHLEALTAAMKQVTGACMPGYHMEGPFLALPGAGADTVPGDVALLNDLLAAADGRVVAMSISPDTRNILPVIERLVERSITPFITHTRASAEQTQAAIDAGARHATHFYDVFPLPEETEPGARPVGAVEAIYANDCTADFICDGVHVHPMAVRACVACKGWQRTALITDSNIGAGLPEGVYDTPWGFRVKVSPTNAARHETKGFLAGSALTMDLGVRNLRRWLTNPLDQIIGMATLAPANIVKLRNKGRLDVGADADLVLWNDELQVQQTWVAGQVVYQA